MENICCFIPEEKARKEFNIVNFVYERNADFKQFSMSMLNSINLVTAGTGIFHTTSADIDIKRGDLFIMLPTKQYFIENTCGLEYIYVSFIGVRANELLYRSDFSEKNPVYSGMENLIDIWTQYLNLATDKNTDIISESAILSAFAQICARNDATVPQTEHTRVKAYIDSHYTESGLSLQSLCTKLNIDYKRLSKSFKEAFGVGFNTYLTQLRMRHAMGLIKHGFSSVKDVANMSGFSDPLYFSKLFRQYYGLPPREYIFNKDNLDD